MEKKNGDIIRRARTLSRGRHGNGPILYWMDRDQRLEDNWALLYAKQEASLRQIPLHIVVFVPPAATVLSSRQLVFQKHGLAELVTACHRKNIGVSVFEGASEAVLPKLIKQLDAHQLVTDFSPLRAKQTALTSVTEALTIPIIEVDSHNIIPAWLASTKKEYAAYTLRPKIQRLQGDFLTPFPPLETLPITPVTSQFSDLPHITDSIASLARTEEGPFSPGSHHARERMRSFITTTLDRYDRDRNNPNLHAQSELSPYLHFGHLSPQRLALEITASEADTASKEVFLEEAVVRRELSDNFCLYEPDYDSFAGFHPWAQKTLNEHRGDTRAHLYSSRQLEDAETHEELWNACQRDLVRNGKLHGFLRMYWAKKILEWSPSPEEALEIAIRLNDTFSLDGSDPNGYAGIAWSIGGIHDRAWPERKVFGKIRYMNERGCRRKFKVDEYINAHPP